MRDLRSDYESFVSQANETRNAYHHVGRIDAGWECEALRHLSYANHQARIWLLRLGDLLKDPTDDHE